MPEQYDGDWTPDAVKKRIIEIMYSWTIGLPKETKISEAYKMLKQQGTVNDFCQWFEAVTVHYLLHKTSICKLNEINEC